MAGSRTPKERRGSWEQSFRTTLEAGSPLICAQEGSVGILDAGATANLVCVRWLTHHDSFLGKMGLPRGPTNPAKARLKFGGGRMGDARFAADITAGIAVCGSNFTASVLDAYTPAFLSKQAVEALGGQLDFSCDTSTSGFREVGVRLKVNETGC